ncbi:hypothetical protein B0H13DRAFT_2381906 [Mycena leptocephala]|nr:hypothetical protein B0H13DRAFT_2381906 [Mycena leptocephala]
MLSPAKFARQNPPFRVRIPATPTGFYNSQIGITATRQRVSGKQRAGTCALGITQNALVSEMIHHLPSLARNADVSPTGSPESNESGVRLSNCETQTAHLRQARGHSVVRRLSRDIISTICCVPPRVHMPSSTRSDFALDSRALALALEVYSNTVAYLKLPDIQEASSEASSRGSVTDLEGCVRVSDGSRDGHGFLIKSN